MTIVIVIVIVIVSIKRIVIMRMWMGMGTTVGEGKSFRRQKTRDKYPPLPSTPPPLGVVFLPHVTTGV